MHKQFDFILSGKRHTAIEAAKHLSICNKDQTVAFAVMPGDYIVLDEFLSVNIISADQMKGLFDAGAVRTDKYK